MYHATKSSVGLSGRSNIMRETSLGETHLLQAGFFLPTYLLYSALSTSLSKSLEKLNIDQRDVDHWTCFFEAVLSIVRNTYYYTISMNILWSGQITKIKRDHNTPRYSGWASCIVKAGRYLPKMLTVRSAPPNHFFCNCISMRWCLSNGSYWILQPLQMITCH